MFVQVKCVARSDRLYLHLAFWLGAWDRNLNEGPIMMTKWTFSTEAQDLELILHSKSTSRAGDIHIACSVKTRMTASWSLVQMQIQIFKISAFKSYVLNCALHSTDLGLHTISAIAKTKMMPSSKWWKWICDSKSSFRVRFRFTSKRQVKIKLKFSSRLKPNPNLKSGTRFGFRIHFV